MVALICGDVEFLVQLRDQVMKDVVEFFHSFSLNKLSDLESLRDLKEKEKLMLDWAEASGDCCQEKSPWTATASQIIDLLSVAHSNSLEDLLAQQKEHGIIMDRPSSSQPFKDLADNSGAFLAQFYSLAKSTYWLGDLVNYIRGGDAKKGKGSSSRPQPPTDDQGGGSGGGNSGGRTTDIVDRFSGSMSREDRGRGRSGERRSFGNRSGHSNRRRYDRDERMDLGPSLIPRRSAKFWCTGKD
ncbi:hypothetical protein F511_39458 [Dorcoceras hygrometricum]|uniref:Uncharacterized protein n=1 Tax=Dorcoceras hygrometricum TaxID=472368 RepID=A0A2Z7A8J6_9LAMI|nr:hypothetical protein F511_39458 [Dorcoceras hygrometricum]